jgi:SAM-dependent methyltransferase
VRFGDVCNLDVPDGFYSGYISLGVVEHRFEGPEPFLKEAHRVLEDKGIMAISVPNYGLLRKTKAKLGFYESSPSTPSNDFYQYAYQTEDFAQILEKSGFSVEHIAYYTVDRLLTEEVSAYHYLRRYNISRYLRDFLEFTMNRFDGHMALFIARKNHSTLR